MWTKYRPYNTKDFCLNHVIRIHMTMTYTSLNHHVRSVQLQYYAPFVLKGELWDGCDVMGHKRRTQRIISTPSEIYLMIILPDGVDFVTIWITVHFSNVPTIIRGTVP